MKTYEIHFDDALAEKFEIALQLTGETADEAMEKLVCTYLADTFSAAASSMRSEQNASNTKGQPQPERRTARRAANQPKPPYRNTQQTEEPQSESFWNKIKNPKQNDHKILRAYFELQKEIGKVTLEALRKRCSDSIAHPDTFVPHFDNNFTRMKSNNSKVFEEKDGVISIWDRISDTLAHCRDYFM